jgi:hypothetical protein
MVTYSHPLTKHKSDEKLVFITALFLLTGIAFSQTLHKGAVIVTSSYTITLKPDVTMNQYLDFYINKYIPAVEENFPGMKIFVLIGDRGDEKFQMGEIMYFESQELRDKYWPTEESEGSDVALAAQKKLETFGPEFSKYIAKTKQTKTDWIIK